MHASGPLKEDTVIGPKIAAVERRKARHRRASVGAPSLKLVRHPALRSPDSYPGPTKTTGAAASANNAEDGAWLFEIVTLQHFQPHPEEARSAVSKDGQRHGPLWFETRCVATLLTMRR